MLPSCLLPMNRQSPRVSFTEGMFDLGVWTYPSFYHPRFLLQTASEPAFWRKDPHSPCISPPCTWKPAKPLGCLPWTFERTRAKCRLTGVFFTPDLTAQTCFLGDSPRYLSGGLEIISLWQICFHLSSAVLQILVPTFSFFKKKKKEKNIYNLSCPYALPDA